MHVWKWCTQRMLCNRAVLTWLFPPPSSSLLPPPCPCAPYDLSRATGFAFYFPSAITIWHHHHYHRERTCTCTCTCSVNAALRLLWQYKDSTTTIESVCTLLQESAEELSTYTELEKLLLQIMHLAMRAGAPADAEKPGAAGLVNTRIADAYERLVLTLAQLSGHVAAKIRYALLAAVEDLHPELCNGQPNPQANAYGFYRCARMLQNVERAVLYGTPILTASDCDGLARAYGWDAVQQSADAERRVRLAAIIASNNALGVATGAGAEQQAPRLSRLRSLADTPVSSLHGLLLFKRQWRRTWHSTKQWKWRYFRIEQQVLFCTRGSDLSDGHVIRAVHLAGCTLQHVLPDDTSHNKHRYKFMLLVRNKMSGQEILVRADDQETFAAWKMALERECCGAPAAAAGAGALAVLSFPPPLLMARSAQPGAETASNGSGNRESVTAGSRTMMARIKRWTAFSNQMAFMSCITDICERLRFLERPMRKPFLIRDLKRLKVPPLIYIPLCDAVDPYSTVLRIVPHMAHAFQTKARCPCLVYVETEAHPWNKDVTTFLQCEVQEYSVNQLSHSRGEVSTDAGASTGAIRVDVLLGAEDEGAGSGYHTSDLDEEHSDDELGGSEGGTVAQAASRVTVKVAHSGEHWRPDGGAVQRLGLLTHGKATTVDAPSPAKPTPASMRYMSKQNAIEEEGTHSSHLNKDHHSEVRKRSAFGHLPTWGISGFIAKSNDDLRQEMFVMQLITYYQAALRAAKCDVYLRTYHVMNTGKSTGAIQLIRASSSIDAVKKQQDFPGTLRRWFVQKFGNEKEQGMLNLPITEQLIPLPGTESPALASAIMRFTQSLAGYSAVSYMLAIKDRHNGNILLTDDGRIVHIDFGFVFGIAPGGKASMETCPFKLTSEFVEVMGGLSSEFFLHFRLMLAQAFTTIRRHADTAIKLVQIMAHDSPYPCFKAPQKAVDAFIARHHLQAAEAGGTAGEDSVSVSVSVSVSPDEDKNGEALKRQRASDKVSAEIADGLIRASYNHFGTRMYDHFQLWTNGIHI